MTIAVKQQKQNNYWAIFHAFLSSADFFQNQLFGKILSGIPLECQTVWIQIRPDKMSGLIWVQTVCKDYQQIALGGERTSPPEPLVQIKIISD